MKEITLITGTSKGIGLALAQHYLAHGHIVIGCSRSEAQWNTGQYAGQYHHYMLDVSDEINVKKMFRQIRAQHGSIDHLINNAGVASMNHSLLTPLNMVHKILDTNVVGTFLFCREAARLMQKRKYGRIVNFSTVAVPLKLEGEAIYAASKAAIVTLSQVLAREFSQYNITVNTIGPTPIKTDLIKAVPQEKIDNLLNRQAIQRFGDYNDVINVIDFFLKRESNFVTGQVIYLGGIG